jgi:hypothetical protein
MRSKSIIFIAAGLLVLGLLFFLFSTNGKQSFLSWNEHYKEQSNNPYGLKVVFQLLKAQEKPGDFTLLKQKLLKALPTRTTRKSSYVFIGAGQYLDSVDAQRLLRFVANGNDAFIATQVLPFKLIEKLDAKRCSNENWGDLNYYQDSMINANFVHPSLRNRGGYNFKYRHIKAEKLYDWHFFDPSAFCDAPRGLVALGKINDSKVNFVRVPHGRGNFYLHSNPIFFTNLFLIKKPGKAYAERVFTHLARGPIYWDCYSKVNREVAERLNDNSRGLRRRDFKQPSPLSYVLSQPPLAWAWYTLLVSTLLYFLFRIKRRQRIIPVLPANKNNSLAFIRTIGRLYFLQNSHRQLALQTMKLFLQFVRDRYKLQTRDLQEEFMQQLNLKSEVGMDKIKYIFELYAVIEYAPEIYEKALVDFHQQIEYFYKTCK